MPFLEDEEDDEEGGIFGAAYDDVTFRDTTDDGVEGDIVDDGVEPLYSEWEYEADRLEQRLSFMNTVARLWKHAAITWGGEAHRPERREVLDQWLHQAGANYRQLLELLEAVHRYRFRQPSGSHESLVEFDRLRTIKDTLIQTIGTGTIPVIKVEDSDYKNNRTLLLKHFHDGRDLQLEYAEKTLRYVHQLWGHDVAMETVIENNPTFLSFADDKLSIRKSA